MGTLLGVVFVVGIIFWLGHAVMRDYWNEAEAQKTEDLRRIGREGAQQMSTLIWIVVGGFIALIVFLAAVN